MINGSKKVLAITLIFTITAMPLFIDLAFAQEKKPVVTPEKIVPVAAAVAEKAQEPVAQTAVKAEEPSVQTPTQVQAQPQDETKEVVSAPVEPGNVTVNFKGADIRTVLAYISEVAGVDIVPAPDVKGIVDLRLTNKPWKSALDLIVRNYGFAYDREGDIIRVVTLDKLKQEELITQSFNLNYSKAKDVVDSVKNLVGDRGKVMYDARTNVLLVTDIPTNIYRVGQIVEKLDKRTEQVLIEARIIETLLGDDEKMGIDWNVKITASGAKRPITFPFDYYSAGSNFLNKYTPLVQTEGTTIAYDPAGNPTTNTAGPFPGGSSGPSGIDPNDKAFPFVDYTVDTMKNAFMFGTLDFSEFKAVLELLKQRSDTDTVSNPRIATLNNNKATINVGDVLNFPRFERNATTGKMEITGYDEKNAGIILNVTPHINDKNEIAVELIPEITEYLGSQPIAPGSDIYAPLFRTRQANTQVMIKDGQTIFIGGLITDRNVDGRTKLPIIGDIFGDVPYLGLLVSKKNITKRRVELIFFITVHIMTPDKVIEDSPLPNKAYIPVYKDTQRGNTANDKKRLKKTY